MKSVSFKSGDGKFTFFVKEEFLARCPNASSHDSHTLLITHKMLEYLHNTSGPAIIRLLDGHQEYWIEGQPVPKEVGEKMAHDANFNDKLLVELSG